jgi:hypothetical protein
MHCTDVGIAFWEGLLTPWEHATPNSAMEIISGGRG